MNNKDLIAEARRAIEDDDAERNRYGEKHAYPRSPGYSLAGRLADALEARQVDEAALDATTEREIAIIEEHREKWMARAFRAEDELAWYKVAAKHSADSMAEARATLQMFADRVDPFVFDELSSVLDDQPLDYETGDVIGEVAAPQAVGERGDPYTCVDLGHEDCDGSHRDHRAPVITVEQIAEVLREIPEAEPGDRRDAAVVIAEHLHLALLRGEDEEP